MRKRIAQTKKSRNANISFEPEFKKWMTQEARQRGFPSLSKFARHALSFFCAYQATERFHVFNEELKRVELEFPTGSGKSQAKQLLAFVWCIVFQLSNLYETIF